MRQLSLAATCLVLSAWTVSAQAPVDTPEFEAASVKPSTAPPNPAQLMFADVADEIGFSGGPGSKDPGRIDYHGVTLKALLARAYDVRSFRISGPSWLATERYDILAKLPPGTTTEQLGLMLQKLLTQRFRIALRHETKILPVYRLTVAKNGPKLKRAAEPPAYKDEAEREAAAHARMKAMMEAAKSDQQRRQPVGFGEPGEAFTMFRATTADLAQKLSFRLDHPVVDMTHLEGLYEFQLKWVQDNQKSPTVDAATSAGPSLFAAIQEQLGLKLESGKEPIELLVIDSALKVPTSN